MSRAAWRRWVFAADGRPRALWRILLFALLYFALLIAGALVLELVPLVLERALVWQGLLSLGAALGAGVWLLVRSEARRPGALGFAWTRSAARECVLGLAIGVGTLALVLGLLVAAGMLTYTREAGSAGAWLAAIASDLLVLGPAAAGEEALFRGYPFQVLVVAIGPVLATALASAGFAAAHLGNPGIGALAVVNIGLAGVLLSLAYLRTRSLWFASALHLGWNWSMASLFDLPVSGLELFDTPLYEASTHGPAWLTGAAFGPEAGAVGTLASLIGIIAVLRLPAVREAAEMRAYAPLVDERLRTGEADVA